MAKRTQKEIQALKDAGYVWNQYEQRWMSQEELRQWNADNQKEARSGTEIFVREMIYGLLAIIVAFALGYFFSINS
jgi:hypothetical protein